MDWFVKGFIKASLAWLVLAVSLGVAMAVRPAWLAYRPAHLHMALLGFVAMMIFGVAYHVIPRFTGNPLHSRKLAAIHWGLANVGLTALVVGFVTRVHWGGGAIPVLASGGVIAAAGAYTFAYNIWRTLDATSRPAVAGLYAVSAHTHAILVGFVMMMILGVALWLFPRPAKDDTRYTPRAAEVQRVRPAGSQARAAQGERF